MTPNDFVNDYHTRNPSPYDWPSVKEDHIALISLIEKYKIKSVFEFGTWQGYTTQLIAEHPNIHKVLTLDIHKGMDVEYSHGAHSKTVIENYGKFIKEPSVLQIFYDSMIFEPSEIVDMVFVDGNHDLQHVINDTALALKMEPKVIAWHDYDSPGNPDIKMYLDWLKTKGRKIVTFPNSIVAYEVRDG